MAKKVIRRIVAVTSQLNHQYREMEDVVTDCEFLGIQSLSAFHAEHCFNYLTWQNRKILYPVVFLS